MSKFLSASVQPWKISKVSAGINGLARILSINRGQRRSLSSVSLRALEVAILSTVTFIQARILIGRLRLWNNILDIDDVSATSLYGTRYFVLMHAKGYDVSGKAEPLEVNCAFCLNHEPMVWKFDWHNLGTIESVPRYVMQLDFIAAP